MSLRTINWFTLRKQFSMSLGVHFLSHIGIQHETLIVRTNLQFLDDVDSRLKYVVDKFPLQALISHFVFID